MKKKVLIGGSVITIVVLALVIYIYNSNAYGNIKEINVTITKDNSQNIKIKDEKSIKATMKCINSSKKMSGVLVFTSKIEPSEVISIVYKDNRTEVINLFLSDNKKSMFYRNKDSMTGYEMPEKSSKELSNLIDKK